MLRFHSVAASSASRLNRSRRTGGGDRGTENLQCVLAGQSGVLGEISPIPPEPRSRTIVFPAKTSPRPNGMGESTTGEAGQRHVGAPRQCAWGGDQTGKVTPVSSSDTCHSRCWVATSWDCLLEFASFGWPRI